MLLYYIVQQQQQQQQKHCLSTVDHDLRPPTVLYKTETERMEEETVSVPC